MLLNLYVVYCLYYIKTYVYFPHVFVLISNFLTTFVSRVQRPRGPVRATHARETSRHRLPCSHEAHRNALSLCVRAGLECGKWLKSSARRLGRTSCTTSRRCFVPSTAMCHTWGGEQWTSSRKNQPTKPRGELKKMSSQPGGHQIDIPRGNIFGSKCRAQLMSITVRVSTSVSSYGLV